MGNTEELKKIDSAYLIRITPISKSTGEQAMPWYRGKNNYTISKDCLSYSKVLCYSWNNRFIATKKAVGIEQHLRCWRDKNYNYKVEVLSYEHLVGDKDSKYSLVSRETIDKDYKYQKAEV